MRAAGKLAAEVLDMVTEHVRPGVSTEALDQICHDFMIAHDAIPAPLNYRGYPKSLCTSINHVVCHGIPGDRKLEEGDIINIDVTVILDGWHGDSSRMYCAGVPSSKARNLIDVTHEALMRGIAAVRPARRSAISAMPSRALSRRSGSASCGISAAMASGGAFTRRPTCCISAGPAKGRS